MDHIPAELIGAGAIRRAQAGLQRHPAVGPYITGQCGAKIEVGGKLDHLARVIIPLKPQPEGFRATTGPGKATRILKRQTDSERLGRRDRGGRIMADISRPIAGHSGSGNGPGLRFGFGCGHLDIRIPAIIHGNGLLQISLNLTFAIDMPLIIP